MGDSSESKAELNTPHEIEDNATAELGQLESANGTTEVTHPHQLIVTSISDEQLFNRCPQNSPISAQTKSSKTTKKAYPEVVIPEDIFP